MKRLSFILCFSLLVFVGCQKQYVSVLQNLVSPPLEINFYRSVDLAMEMPRRVAIAVFDANGSSEEAVDMISHTFADELAKRGKCEVVFPPSAPAFFLPHTGITDGGRIDLEALSKAKKQLNVDGFLLGTLTSWDPYDPPRLGLKVQLVSATTGKVLWAADAIVDGSEPGVRRCAKQYYEREQEGDSAFGWKIVLTSPRRFSQFVSYHFLETMETE